MKIFHSTSYRAVNNRSTTSSNMILFFMSHYRKQRITLLPLHLFTQSVPPVSLKGANSAASQKLHGLFTYIFDLVVFMFINNLFKGLKNMCTTLQNPMPVATLAG